MGHLNDGAYGSLNCIFNDHTAKDGVRPHVLHPDPSAEHTLATVWGPTCCSLDCIIRNMRLPKMRSGDWLYFPDMGAYTVGLTSGFNGFQRLKPFYYIKGNSRYGGLVWGWVV